MTTEKQKTPQPVDFEETIYIKIEKEHFLSSLGFDNNYIHAKDSTMLGWKIEFLSDSNFDLCTFKFTEVKTNYKFENSEDVDEAHLIHVGYDAIYHSLSKPTPDELRSGKFLKEVFLKNAVEVDFFFLDYNRIVSTLDNVSSYLISSTSIAFSKSLTKGDDHPKDVYDILYIQLLQDDYLLVQKDGSGMHRPLFILAPPCPPDWLGSASGLLYNIVVSNNKVIEPKAT